MDLYYYLASLPIFKKVFIFLETGGFMLAPLIILAFFMWLLIVERFISILFRIQSCEREYQRNSTTNKLEERDHRKKIEIDRYLYSKSNERLFRKNISLIKQFIVIAPLLGLLGTVTGMIEVFEVIKIHGSENIVLIGQGFSHATIPTMFGLTIAVFGFFSLIFLENTVLKKAMKRRT